jgi:hypothetical protein
MNLTGKHESMKKLSVLFSLAVLAVLLWLFICSHPNIGWAHSTIVTIAVFLPTLALVIKR